MQKSTACRTPHVPTILLVDDNESDAELVQIAVEELRRPVRLEWVRDGEVCMEYLEKGKGHSAAERPYLILLDLRMPRMSGFEVLQALAKDTDLKRIPVVVLTTSTASRDVEEAYRLGCKSYILKPLGYADFAAAIARVCNYWFDLNTGPSPKVRGSAP